LDYRNDGRHEGFTEQLGSGSVRWIIVSVRHVLGFEVGVIYRAIKAGQPEGVIGSSDIPCLWLARRLAMRLGVADAVDLYDNFESIGQAGIPWCRRMLQTSIREADAVIAVSSALKAKVMNHYAPRGSVATMN